MAELMAGLRENVKDTLIGKKIKIKRDFDSHKEYNLETGEEKEKTVARWDYEYYKAIYDVAKSKGLIDKYGIVWGGNWKQKDSVHFQLGIADNIQFRR